MRRPGRLARRHELSTWQLLILLGLVAVSVVAAPVVSRASGSLVTLVDPTATTSVGGAKVTGGALQVLPVRRNPSFQLYRHLTQASPSQPLPTTGGLSITSITLTNSAPHSEMIEVNSFPQSNGECPASPLTPSTVARILVPASQTVELQYSEVVPLRISADCGRYRLTDPAQDSSMDVTLVGYRA